MADPIRILIVDGHAAARAVIGRLLAQEDDLELVGEAGSGREAVFEARALKPDVILIDVVMPDQTGLEVLPSLVREHSETKVLLLSMQDDPGTVRGAFGTGASGCLSKAAAAGELGA